MCICPRQQPHSATSAAARSLPAAWHPTVRNPTWRWRDPYWGSAIPCVSVQLLLCCLHSSWPPAISAVNLLQVLHTVLLHSHSFISLNPCSLKMSATVTTITCEHVFPPNQGLVQLSGERYRDSAEYISFEGESQGIKSSKQAMDSERENQVTCNSLLPFRHHPLQFSKVLFNSEVMCSGLALALLLDRYCSKMQQNTTMKTREGEF